MIESKSDISGHIAVSSGPQSCVGNYI